MFTRCLARSNRVLRCQAGPSIFRRSHGDHHSDDEGGSLPLLIFDLDGTLVETAPDLHAALKQTLAAAGRPTDLTLRDMEPMIGDGVAKLVERAFASQLGVATAGKAELKEAVKEFTSYYSDHCCEQSHLYPRVKDTLERLEGEGYAMAVCTNKPQKPARAILDKLGLAGHFKVLVGGDTILGLADHGREWAGGRHGHRHHDRRWPQRRESGQGCWHPRDGA